MKKIIMIALIAVITSIMLMGCEKEKTTARILDKELSNLNENIETNISKGAQNGGFWSKVGKVCAVAGADIVGAVEGAKIGGKTGAAIGTVAGGHTVEGALIGGAIGGAIVGGGASYGAYCGVKSGIPYPAGYNNSRPLSQYANISECGKYHNIYLDEIISSSGNPNMSTLYQSSFSEKMSQENYDTLVSIIGPTSDISFGINKILDKYIQSGYKHSVLLNEYKEYFGFTFAEELFLTYFFEAYSLSCSIDAAFAIIDSYIKFLNYDGRSYFTDEEVDVLNCAMSVALYSTDYWSVLAK